MSALDIQVGGSHYKDLKIQPVEYIHANGIGYMEGNVIKYVTRWREKNGIKDLEKAKHYIELLIEMENKQSEPVKEVKKVSDDGWIEWNGGEASPITNGDYFVTFKCRNGSITSNKHPEVWSWTHKGLDDDIVAYKVHK